MPKFKVWFSTILSPGYYPVITEAPNSDTLQGYWEDDPNFIGISKADKSDIPPVIQERHKPDANHV